MYRITGMILVVSLLMVGTVGTAAGKEPFVPVTNGLDIELPTPVIPQGTQNQEHVTKKDKDRVRVLPKTGTRQTTTVPTAVSAQPKAQKAKAQKADVEAVNTLSRKMPLLYGISRTIPPEATALPVLGRMPGAKKPVTPMVIHARDGVNYVAKISCCMPNRIATPFYEAQVVDSSNSNIITSGGNVYVIPKSQEPFGIYISDKRSVNSPVVSLTLVPSRIPGQTVIVQLDDVPSRADDIDNNIETADSYTDWIRNLYRTVLKNEMPSGFVVHKMKKHSANVDGLQFVPLKRYSGQNVDIYVYEITNTSKTTVELNEASFYQKGVKAVALYPAIKLEPSQKTCVYIMAGKQNTIN
ncbi:TraK protein [Desulfacinum hydrothermale DSM 13146]|uniref:TraK protein n=1 Tax=Desulfacinum hydrothermale DSM 13146 TaxID=1121390 RepID=A0A1W1XX40_9BACT|nr:type-F conjugative transfer system secretin TraK [Desulfacinum hydrothermale]SMC28101.1 TraK protein [Desulfacinum hydrothermale DSM 13146]